MLSITQHLSSSWGWWGSYPCSKTLVFAPSPKTILKLRQMPSQQAKRFQVNRQGTHNRHSAYGPPTRRRVHSHGLPTRRRVARQCLPMRQNTDALLEILRRRIQCFVYSVSFASTATFFLTSRGAPRSR